MTTKVFIENYKGGRVFAVWEVNASGAKVGNWPIVSFGHKKASALYDHLNELQAYIVGSTNTDE